MDALVLSPEQVDFFTLVEEQFKRCHEFESDARRKFIEDMRFAHGDSDNLWQWDASITKDRSENGKPCLTINKTRQHNLQIVNDARQNKPSIAIRPTGGGSSYEAAMAIAGIIRHIEYHSNAQAIYDSATNFMVQGGAGYWRVITEYCNDAVFEQDIKIKHITDPLGVYIDPDAREPDKSDMNYAFIFESMNKKLVKAKYPHYKDSDGTETLSLTPDTPFLDGEDVMICEYYRRTWTNDVLYRNAMGALVRESELDEAGIELFKSTEGVSSRPMLIPQVEWFLIIGRNIMDSKTVPGKYIPVVQITGEETRIDGVLDRKSHTRALKDPQRMYNYWSSASVEYGALQTKTPWAGPAEAFEGHENVWKRANLDNLSYLPYNGFNDAGQPIAPPTRVAPPMAAPVCLEGMKVSQMEMMLVSGQYDNAMGEQGNERTGKAINARQRQGDNATYHYINGLALGVQYTGRIILGMIPVIYDTERVVMILGADSSTEELKIAPEQEQAYTEEPDPATGAPIHKALNPKVGYYEVQADTGPGYATQREEAFNAFALILTQNPNLTGLIGDIMLKAADFPLAAEAAERLKRMVPPAALGNGPTQQEQEMAAQMENMKGTIKALMDQLILSESKVLRQQDKVGVEKYKAFTERVKVLMESNKSQAELKLAYMELVNDMLLGPEELTNEQHKTPPSTTPRPLGPNGGMLGNRFME